MQFVGSGKNEDDALSPFFHCRIPREKGRFTLINNILVILVQKRNKSRSFVLYLRILEHVI